MSKNKCALHVLIAMHFLFLFSMYKCSHAEDTANTIAFSGRIDFFSLSNAASWAVPGAVSGVSEHDLFASSPYSDGSVVKVDLPQNNMWGARIYLADPIDSALVALRELVDAGVTHLQVFSDYRNRPTVGGFERALRVISNGKTLRELHFVVFLEQSEFKFAMLTQCVIPLKNLHTLSVATTSQDDIFVSKEFRDTTVKHLSIHALRGIDLDSVDNMTHLTSIGLYGYVHQRDLTQYFRKLSSVESIMLDLIYGSQRARFDMSILRDFQNLRFFSCGNELTTSDLAELSYCTRLTGLGADSFEPGAIQIITPLMKQIAYLQISNTRQMLDEDITSLSRFTNLKQLFVGGRDHDSRFYEAIAGLPLTTLMVTGQDASASAEAIQSFVSKTQSIQRLRLDSSSVDLAAHFPLFCQLKELLYIDVVLPLLPNHYEALRLLPHLESVTVSSSSFDDECASVFRSLKIRRLAIQNASCLTRKGYKALFSSDSNMLSLSQCVFLEPEFINSIESDTALDLRNIIQPIDRYKEAIAGKKTNLRLYSENRRFRIKQLTSDLIRHLTTLQQSGLLGNDEKGYYANQKLPPEIPKHFNGFSIRYFSNSSDNSSDDATKYVMIAIPIKFMQGMTILSMDESGQMFTLDEITEQNYAGHLALTRKDIDFSSKGLRFHVDNSEYSLRE